MNKYTQEIANRQIKSVTVLAVVIDVVLFVLKVLVGFLAGSIALVVDGVHSLSDAATDVAVLLGYYFGSKQADQSHPYGHGRIETFSAVFVSVVLILIGAGAVYYAAVDMAKGNIKTAHTSVLIAAMFSVFVKELLYRITKRTAVKSYSTSLYANAWHHRSDAASSVAVLIGFITLRIGFNYGDQIAAIAVGLMIIWVAARILSPCITELAEGAVDRKTVEKIKQIIGSKPSIRHWHKLRTRTVGREIFLDLHVLVDPNLNIAAAHEISENLEKTLCEQIVRPVNIIVHLEPDTPEMRKKPPVSPDEVGE
ncbi:cation diffusion facilitator family transporter [Planctomycetota bacterium]